MFIVDSRCLGVALPFQLHRRTWTMSTTMNINHVGHTTSLYSVMQPFNCHLGPCYLNSYKPFLTLSDQYLSPKQDSNLGLHVSVILNLTNALNHLATTAGFSVTFIDLIINFIKLKSKMLYKIFQRKVIATFVGCSISQQFPVCCWNCFQCPNRRNQNAGWPRLVFLFLFHLMAKVGVYYFYSNQVGSKQQRKKITF